jgi:tetratricopeptide (TPR) repeat protein
MMSEPELTGATNPQHARQFSARLAALLARRGIICLLLATATLALFWPLKNCDYLYLDDPTYTTSNPHVRQGLTLDGVVWAFSTRQASNWHPLTWLSHMLDVDFFGLGPGGPHMENLLIHIANTVLLFLLLREFTGAHWRSAFVAALFALHPLHVESVAWIAERKDVLSTLFWFLTLWTYGRYARESKVRSPKSKLYYALALLAFVLGLMSKPMLVTLPFVLLLLDYWPLGRLPNFSSPVSDGHPHVSNFAPLTSRLSPLLPLLWEKIPFFVLSAISSVVTLFAQSKAMGSLATFPIAARLENVIVSYARYLGKTFWPAELALPYPHPGQWPIVWVISAVAIVAGLSAAALRFGRKMPFVITGWFWFLGTLIPVIGLVQVGAQSMADRYTYVPLVGLFILLVWGADAALARWHLPEIVARAAAAMVLGACAIRTADQLRYWQNSETLFRHSIAITKNNPLAYSNLGYYLYNHGHWEEAIEDYHQALRMNPSDYASYDNLGFCYYNQGHLEEAITNYQQALRINPNDANTLNNLGTALTRRKQLPEAIQCYEAALRARPDYPDAHNNLGVVLDEIGRTGEAIRHYNMALRLAPDDVQAHNNLANALAGQGQVNEAINHYRQALRLNPDFTQALNNLGWMLAGQSEYGEAIACYTRALKLKPDDEVLHKNLGNILARMGRNDEAVRQYTEALRLEPSDAEAHFGLGRALAQRGGHDEAVAHLREALRIRPDYTEAKRELQALGATAPE